MIRWGGRCFRLIARNVSPELFFCGLIDASPILPVATATKRQYRCGAERVLMGSLVGRVTFALRGGVMTTLVTTVALSCTMSLGGDPGHCSSIVVHAVLS